MLFAGMMLNRGLQRPGSATSTQSSSYLASTSRPMSAISLSSHDRLPASSGRLSASSMSLTKGGDDLQGRYQTGSLGTLSVN